MHCTDTRDETHNGFNVRASARVAMIQANAVALMFSPVSFSHVDVGEVLQLPRKYRKPLLPSATSIIVFSKQKCHSTHAMLLYNKLCFSGSLARLAAWE